MTPKPPYWRVPVLGSKFDLDFLPEWFSVPGLATYKDGDEDTYLVGEDFERLNDDGAIWERASELLTLINGAGSLQSDFRPFTLGSVQRVNEDGTKIGYMRASGRLFAMRGRARLTALVTAPDGTLKEMEKPEPPSTTALANAQTNDGVAFVLGLLNEPSWDELYKIHERMESALGPAYRDTIGQSSNELQRFTQTANHTARHDPQKYRPHKNPMSLEDGLKFIRTNVIRWLATFVRHE